MQRSAVARPPGGAYVRSSFDRKILLYLSIRMCEIRARCTYRYKYKDRVMVSHVGRSCAITGSDKHSTSRWPVTELSRCKEVGELQPSVRYLDDPPRRAGISY